MKYIDSFLNKQPMYGLVLNSLKILAFISVIFGFMALLPFSGVSLILHFFVLALACYTANALFAKSFGVSANFESASITALILFFIIAPATTSFDYGIVVLAGVLAMASKYLLTIRDKHLFNPAAISLVILGLFGMSNSIWWVATPSLLPFVLIASFLILRKVEKLRLFFVFLVAALVSITLFAFIGKAEMMGTMSQVLISWPLLFFGAFMLTEPLTSPGTRKEQIIYGILVGLLFGAQFHFGPVSSTPELALVIGNLYYYIVSAKYHALLVLHEKNELAPLTYEFVFSTTNRLDHKPGQYLEWTLPHKNVDSRGMRRYFTVASSPTESDIKIGIRMSPENGSSFKTHLLAMKAGDTILAGGLTGDFVMPEDTTKKLVFIAGGIGVTPFRSMVKYLIDKNEKRDVVVFYSNKTADDIAYKDIFDKGEQMLGIKTIYVLNNPGVDLSVIPGAVAAIDAKLIEEKVSDLKNRIYYISGPHGMVVAFEGMLKTLGVPASQIKVDFFPGY